MTVGQILQPYDSDNRYPLYGFGAVLPETSPYESSKVGHCFAMNGDIYNPEVYGVEGVLAAYSNAIQKVQLKGPTYFKPILEYVNGYCQQRLQ